MDDKEKQVRTPLFPLYSDVRACITAWQGETAKSVLELINTIHSLTGTPQDPVDWSDPDSWIADRLVGESARLARKLWDDSGKKTNPRHIYGCYLFINSMNLLDRSSGTYVLKQRGMEFLQGDSTLIAELDAIEGLPRVLSLVAQKSQAKRSDLLEDWGNYLLQVSKFATLSTFKDSLRRRILNLVERGLLDRDGNRYAITEMGANYLKQFGEQGSAQANQGSEADVATALNAHNVKQRERLQARLMALAPYEFEHFVRELLEAMDYDNVTVTKQSGDKGVDVVANFQFGITEIKEVVQVKRTESTITRPIIDQLRGALSYHGALRGTIITLGRFAKGIEQFALYHPPITLIDGKRLIELIEKHEVGIRRKQLAMLEIDEAFFADKSDSESETALGVELPFDPAN
jgi:restriction system protein